MAEKRCLLVNDRLCHDVNDWCQFIIWADFRGKIPALPHDYTLRFLEIILISLAMEFLIVETVHMANRLERLHEG